MNPLPQQTELNTVMFIIFPYTIEVRPRLEAHMQEDCNLKMFSRFVTTLVFFPFYCASVLTFISSIMCYFLLHLQNGSTSCSVIMAIIAITQGRHTEAHNT